MWQGKKPKRIPCPGSKEKREFQSGRGNWSVSLRNRLQKLSYGSRMHKELGSMEKYRDLDQFYPGLRGWESPVDQGSPP